jgi:hypothetical protein
MRWLAAALGWGATVYCGLALYLYAFHCRDLSENEPFDFLTWFEYAPADEAAFNQVVAALRATEEYVEREVDIRLVREEA